MIRVLQFGAVVLCGAASLKGTEPETVWKFSAEQLQPFWRSTTMYGETVLFVSDGPGAEPSAALLFKPTRILSVGSASGEVTYEEGRDYIWHAGSREISLPAGSRIVFKSPQDLRRPAGTQAYALTHRDGQGEILFGGGHEYQDMQTVVTYEHQATWPTAVPALARDQLPRTLRRLTAKEPLAIALLGDSISTGCNASGWAKVAPFQPPYQDLLVMNLESAYGTKVTLANFAVGGTDTAWGLANIGKLIEARPDLVILAFGMNDSAGRPAKDYQANMQAMMEAVRRELPGGRVRAGRPDVGKSGLDCSETGALPPVSRRAGRAVWTRCGPRRPDVALDGVSAAQEGLGSDRQRRQPSERLWPSDLCAGVVSTADTEPVIAGTVNAGSPADSVATRPAAALGPAADRAASATLLDAPRC